LACRRRTFLAVVGYFREIDEVRSDDVAVDAVAVAKLDLDAATQRRKHLREDDLLVPDRKHLREDDLLVPDRKHLCEDDLLVPDRKHLCEDDLLVPDRLKHLREDDLLVPDRLVTVLLHRCFALYMRARTPEYY